MKIITGGAGFIGSAICWRLNTLGISDIIIVDESREGTKETNLSYLKFTEYIDKDEFIKQIRSDSFKHKADTLYHMGACSSTTEGNMEYLKENNVEYSKSLAKWCLAGGVRYVYASSAATYGAGELGFDDDIAMMPKLKPINKYGQSKQLFDMWVLENKLDKEIVGLKYFNVFGPNENHKGDMRSMINKTYGQILKTGKLQLFKSLKTEYKDGEQKRDFIYVKDAVDMTLFFDKTLGQGSAQNGIFNVGSGKASTWLELAGAIFSALGKEPNIEFIDMPDSIKNQYQYFTQANISKIRKAGYDSKIMELKDSVRDYVVNYLVPDKYLDQAE
jgi:ADP-L-glycero-D-manno-heptose 6-epimerase